MNQPLPDKQKHIVVIAIGTAGDIYPMLRIALALQQRHHQITFLCPEHYAPSAERAGVPVHAIISREDFKEVLGNPHAWHPRKSIKLLFGKIHSKAQPLLDLLKNLSTEQEEQGCVFLTHPLALPLADIIRAQQPEIRIVAVYLAPANLRTVYDPLTIGPLTIPQWLPQRCRHWLWRCLEKYIIDPATLSDLNLLRRDNGLPPVSNFFDYWYQIANLSVTCFPTWFAQTQPDWPQPHHPAYFQLYDPQPERPPSAELSAFLAQDGKPIVFTPGTGNLQAKTYFHHAMQTTIRLGQRAIFLTGFPEQLPSPLPDNILWQSYIPLTQLLPRVSALVHHGGIGTTAEALRAGVPQLIVPLAHDQFDNGMRIQALGVGYTLPASGLSTGKMISAIEKLLTSASIQQQCQLIASHFTAIDDEEALCQRITET